MSRLLWKRVSKAHNAAMRFAPCPLPVSFMRSALCVLLLIALTAGCVKDRSFTIGESAPEISALDVNGRTVKLSQFHGKVVVVRFWSGRCRACVAEMPLIDEYRKKYLDRGLEILAVNRGDTKAEIDAFAEDLKLSYPVLHDPALIASTNYRVASVPTTFFIDRRGIAVKMVVGEMRAEQFEGTVQELL